MKIIHLDIWPVTMALREPYTIAYETISTTTNIFLKIQTNSGIHAYGCAAPDLEVTGETPEGVMALFKQKVEPFLHGQNPFRIHWLMEVIRQECPKSPSLLAMVDMALYDLLAKKAGLPLYQLLGGYRDSIPTSITVGIMPVAETLERTMEYARQGFFIFKIKGGLSVDLDVARMMKLREELGERAILRFDANQGYSVEETIRFVKETRDCGIEILEQPTSRDTIADMGAVTSQTHLPIMADESLMNLSDMFYIAKNDFADMINIKLMKLGGITTAVHINSVAKSAGLEAMVGCMDESALGIAAGLHFALSRPNIHFADLDGHLDLIDDPAAGGVILKDGVLYPRELPGLGINL